jgi:hypothetical protein
MSENIPSQTKAVEFYGENIQRVKILIEGTVVQQVPDFTREI